MTLNQHTAQQTRRHSEFHYGAARRMEDALIDQHNAAIAAARPRFTAVSTTRTLERNPRLMDMWDRRYCVRPSLTWMMQPAVPRSAHWFETNDYAEAELVMRTMLFCGAPEVSIHHYSPCRRFEMVETWRAL